MSTYTSLYGVPSHVAPEIPTATTGHVPASPRLIRSIALVRLVTVVVVKSSGNASRQSSSVRAFRALRVALYTSSMVAPR